MTTVANFTLQVVVAIGLAALAGAAIVTSAAFLASNVA